MKKLILITLVLFVFSSCISDEKIKQNVEYSYDHYEISTWNYHYNYSAQIETTSINLLDSLKEVEYNIAEERINKLRELNNQ
jgi:hypothetical protein